jgi:hypothetical protein
VPIRARGGLSPTVRHQTEENAMLPTTAVEPSNFTLRNQGYRATIPDVHEDMEVFLTQEANGVIIWLRDGINYGILAVLIGCDSPDGAGVFGAIAAAVDYSRQSPEELRAAVRMLVSFGRFDTPDEGSN